MGRLIGAATTGRCDHGCRYGDSNSGSHPAGQHAFDGSTRPAVDPDSRGRKALVCNGPPAESGIYDGL
ncbi:hypothetical protein DSI35_00980 [Mycobacterium tuberculosis]|uniref:Uncharacterized protein n=7 Tax=Mycobacterium tuberculosis complex TaxID=77643 RepID=R4MLY8_MYCTX|nr:hypothetical protein [Mycobacterium tuberculosis]AFE17850.1 hypothetical protein MRGA327_18700 [Mycobacterium tuberculosis RGTB327]AGJ69160.1 hypothetical protein J112_16305 [Mycobacterium tuberculosis str. Beijing/NITR203]AGL28492.1 hypothetical protein J113_21210 [Mycobacterium tuberculosis CAS/NITR204]AGL32544.1 hypothetical protein J114_16275 [Mycobacterium tuberculosis EAI5/NITR206]AKR02909.1 hypothetical protein Mb1595_p3386 [Mycobacterium tuberculosis variant bovis]AMO12533.1 hypoth